MASTQASIAVKRVVLDASFVVAYCTNEPVTGARATAEVANYLAAGCIFYAPGVIIPESLCAFCEMETGGRITVAERKTALQVLAAFLSGVRSSPNGDLSLLQRTMAIHGSYTKNKTADSVYIALAELLAQRGPAELVTFDTHMNAQAAANAPTVIVRTP